MIESTADLSAWDAGRSIGTCGWLDEFVNLHNLAKHITLFTNSFGEEVHRPFVYDLKNILSHLSFRLRVRFLTPFKEKLGF